MKALLTAFLWLLASCAHLFAAQPNILFILTEDQGAHMSALGRTDIQTPNMDSLAASGALFRRAYVAYPVCSASKACIMTGLHSHVNGLVNNTNNYLKRAEKLTDAEKKSPPYLHTRIRSTAPTLVEVLVQNGYHAAVSGKLHVSPNERFPYHDFFPKVPAKHALNGTIKRAAGKPWFLMHNTITSTHRPFVNSEKQPISIDPAKVVLPPHLPDTPVIRRDWAEYLDGVQKADQAVGDALDALRDSGAESNTIIVFMGDHGPAYPHGKMTPYHFGLHVPLVIRLPGAKPLISDALVSEIDLLPTLLDVLGIGYEAPLHGKSLKPLIEGQKEAKGHEFIFAEVSGRSLNQKRGMEERAVLDATHQLILRSRLEEPKVINADLRDMKPWINRIYGELVLRKAEFPEAFRMLQTMDPHALGGNPPLIELYDLQNDPGELHNLADDPAAKPHLDRLLAAFKTWHSETKDEAMIVPASGL
ncbi:sulfatase [Prosthecobacter sp.]|jgi:N-sulfoglucosamine sulfohydrolase|uniref:sulfatase n=1 Tax=Prosthecobacter sp. TaxID=1965333 RepID=UPI0037844E8A